MDVVEAIQKRRSVRHFKPDDIPDDVLERLLNAMRLAPSGANYQPWKFIVVKEKEIKSKFAAACEYETRKGNRISQSWIAEAPVVIVACELMQEGAIGYYKDEIIVITKKADLDADMKLIPGKFISTIDMDIAIAFDHLALTARAEGLGTCWVGTMYAPKVRDLFGIPENVQVQIALALGYPVEWPEPRPRKTLEQIICYDRYSE